MRRTRISTAAVLFGVGLGGLFNAILFERIAGWPLPPSVWFYLALWLAALVGVLFLWSSFRAPGRAPSGRHFAGFGLVGWGGVSAVESLVLLTYQSLLLGIAGLAVLAIGLAQRDAPGPGPL